MQVGGELKRNKVSPVGADTAVARLCPHDLRRRVDEAAAILRLVLNGREKAGTRVAAVQGEALDAARFKEGEVARSGASGGHYGLVL